MTAFRGALLAALVSSFLLFGCDTCDELEPNDEPEQALVLDMPGQYSSPVLHLSPGDKDLFRLVETLGYTTISANIRAQVLSEGLVVAAEIFDSEAVSLAYDDNTDGEGPRVTLYVDPYASYLLSFTTISGDTDEGSYSFRMSAGSP